MPKTLVLTTDLPYFPGKMGVDYFNLRHLAQQGAVGVIGPAYPHFPETGMRNLESVLTHAGFWPRPAEDVELPASRPLGGHLARWVKRLPPAMRKVLLEHLIGLRGQPADAWQKLAILANCAPHVVAALRRVPWQVVVLIQTSIVPWLDYLPAFLPKLIYFHDVRTHFATRQATVQSNESESVEIAAQERRAAREADCVAFVSELDEQRAREMLGPTAETGVAPIPVDADYFIPCPPDRPAAEREVILFTGHLSHPPNVDAVVWFLREVWPLVRNRRPKAVFQVTGMAPSDTVCEAVKTAGANVELHANVPDIRPYFWDASAYVVPMRFGGGVRQKIFEAWLMRVPVISTTMGAEGVRADSGRNCWLADDPSGLAGKIAEVLAEGCPAGLLDCARETVLAHNSVPIAAGKFAALVRRTVHLKRHRAYKLLFDLRWMQIGQAGGIEQGAFELIDAMAKLDRTNEYRIHSPRKTYLEWKFPRTFRHSPCFTDKHELRAEALLAGTVNGLATSLGHPAIWNPAMRALRRWHRQDFDLVHSLNGFIHPDLRAFPSVLTGIDLQHVHLPEFFSAVDRRVREELYRESSHSAGHIVPISEFTRQDLHRTYGVPLARMTTVWNIPSRAAWLPMAEKRARDVLLRMGLEAGGYIFFPAHSWPHKNHVRLVEAFALAVSDLPPTLKLVLTGRAFDENHPAQLRINDLGLRGRVRHLGYRSTMELQALYRGAKGLVFPSLFEGFGMPVAEAMLAGCPIACSNSTSLPEIAGDAAILFDPLDPEKIAQALVTLSSDPSRRAELIAAGARRKGLFSPRLSAVKILSVYRRVFDEYYS